MIYHTDSFGPDEDAILRALRHAMNLAVTRGNNEVLIKIPNISNIDGAISNVLGDNLAKRLKKNRSVDIQGVQVFLESGRTKTQFSKGVILAAYPSEKSLTGILSDYRGTDTVYIPWAEAERASYLAANPASSAV